MTPRNQETKPWGTLLALLASCLATLAAVAANVDPHIVLRRALEAGLVVAAAWTVGRLLFAIVLTITDR